MIKKSTHRRSPVVVDERDLAATAGGFDDIPYCGTPWRPFPIGPIQLPPINLPGIVIGS